MFSDKTDRLNELVYMEYKTSINQRIRFYYFKRCNVWKVLLFIMEKKFYEEKVRDISQLKSSENKIYIRYICPK